MRRTGWVTVVAAGLLFGCNPVSETVDPSQPILEFSVSDLPRPAAGYYRLWAEIYEFNKPSSGNSVLHTEFVHIVDFTVGSNGKPTDTLGRPLSTAYPPGKDPQLLKGLFISLYLPGMPDRTPGPALLAGPAVGDYREARSTLSVAEAVGWRAGFDSVRGAFVVMAPTSASGDSNSGVWFIRSLPPAAQPGLRGLPLLPAGLAYEGWISTGTGALRQIYSTGRFVVTDSADQDGAGSGRGPNPGLPFPGQDFINGIPSRPDLRNYEVSVTIEPAESALGLPVGILLLSSRRPPGEAPLVRDLYGQTLPTASFRMLR